MPSTTCIQATAGCRMLQGCLCTATSPLQTSFHHVIQLLHRWDPLRNCTMDSPKFWRGLPAVDSRGHDGDRRPPFTVHYVHSSAIPFCVTLRNLAYSRLHLDSQETRYRCTDGANPSRWPVRWGSLCIATRAPIPRKTNQTMS